MCIKMGTFLGWNHIKGNLVPYKLFLVSTYSCFTSQPWITSSKRFRKFIAVSFLFYFVLVSKYDMYSVATAKSGALAGAIMGAYYRWR